MANEKFRLVSPDFDNGGRLPRKYTAEGQGALKELSPPLEWYGVPYGTKSLALLVQDIDAPKPSSPLVPWVHWVVINIPPSLKGLPAGFSRMEQVLGGDYTVIQEGVNDWKMHGYRGPKPPTHGHRYQFKLYALNDWLDLGNKGACNRAFHLQCILKWVNSQTPQPHCPMCRREWQFKG